MHQPEAPRHNGRPPANGLIQAILRVPLYYKIILANVAIVAAVAVLGATLEIRVFGGLVLIVVNGLLLRLALRPLDELELAAAAVQAGHLHTRVATSPVADPDMMRLIDTFNAMVSAQQEYQRRQRDLSRRALNAAEEERKRVATDLHDKTAQTLAGLLVQLSLVKAVNDPETRTALLKEASEQASFAMDEVYRVVQALRPPALEMLGLKGAVEAHARSVGEDTDVRIEVESDDLRGALDPQTEIALYRILQEALSNVLRHANATRALIRLTRRDDGVLVTIQDDGTGFAAEEVLRDGRSLGLFGMQERASYLGGTLEIKSNSGGTTVEVKIPVS